MKKFLLVSLFSVLCTVNYSYSLAPLTSLLQNPQSDEMGKRYIKLGMSWIVSGDLEKAENYLTYGIKIVKRSGNKYWTAVGYEFYGYLNLAKEDRDVALEYLYAARKLYDRYGGLRDGGGSDVSISTIISLVENGEPTIFDGGNIPSVKPTGVKPPNKTNKNANSGLQQKLNEVMQKIDELEIKYSDLKGELKNLAGSVGANSGLTNPTFARPGNSSPINPTFAPTEE